MVGTGVLLLSLGDLERLWREFSETPGKSPHFKQAIFYSSTVTTKHQVLITHASQALGIRYCKSDAAWLTIMATIFDGLVSEAEMAGLQSSSKTEAKTEEGFFCLPQVPLGIARVYIHFSIGQDQSDPKSYFLFLPLLTGLVSSFRWLLSICRLVPDYVILSNSCRLSTVILDLILLCNCTKQTTITKYFAPCPKSDSPVVCLGARQNGCVLLFYLKLVSLWYAWVQANRTKSLTSTLKFPASWLNNRVSFCFRRLQ